MEQLNRKIFTNLIACMILFSLAWAGTVFAEPYFSIDDPVEWEAALADGSVKPVEEADWNQYMPQWQAHLVEGEAYPDNQFFAPDLYVYGGTGEDNDVGGLVMTWGDGDTPPPPGSYSSAWYYDYGVDPDLSNCTITITVVAPQFSPTDGSQINAVSLGMRDVTGAVRGWHWTCGAVGSGAPIEWGVPTTITINTALFGVGAATPTATGYMNNPGFNLVTVIALIVDENAQWNWQAQQTPPPPPGTTLIKPWNLWEDLSVAKNTTNPINVGINIDVHQNNPDEIANDYHIEGRIESGPRNGTWSDPPVLLEHIDGEDPFKFPNFSYSITPDTSDATGNWYLFTADWSGKDIPYCTTIHLGLLFDVTCHNIIIDLIGWWTVDGNPLSIEPILGFDVQDGIEDASTTLQTVKLQNREIPIEIVAMDLVSLPPGTQIPFDQLRGGTSFVEGLPWVPLANDMGPISPNNRFQVDSFFDVFFEITVPAPPELGTVSPMQPVRIDPGGFLILRQNVPYIDGEGAEQDRWFFEIHEAHDGANSDLGDAPDSSNTTGIGMTTYPSGIQANYPTVYVSGSPPHGPIHLQPAVVAHLGRSVTAEFEADTGPDVDPTNNIIPPTNQADLDYADDGVLGLPFTLTSCQLMKFNYLINVNMTWNVLYVNVWFDWNRDGDWDDSFNCSNAGTAVMAAPEWAVQNQQLINLPLGLNTMTSLPFRPYLGVDSAGNDIPEDHPIWMRITLSEQKWQPPGSAGGLGTGGRGPAAGYQYGETEDYYFVPKETCYKDPDLDWSGLVDLNDFRILAGKWLQTIP